jgi:hypothetical protein
MDHRAEAEKYLRIDAGTENSTLGRDALGAAEVHALLDIADAIRQNTTAIREQTDGLQNWGVVVR